MSRKNYESRLGSFALFLVNLQAEVEFINKDEIVQGVFVAAWEVRIS